VLRPSLHSYWLLRGARPRQTVHIYERELEAPDVLRGLHAGQGRRLREDCGQAWLSGEQRGAGLVTGPCRRLAPHRAWQAAADRFRGKLQRQAGR
jgi:hypothetical protein